jgi:hypothetical protein
MLCVILGSGAAAAGTAYAGGNDVADFDASSVLDDLGSATVNGAPFKLEDYPADPDGAIGIITVIEYCYSFYTSADNYGLYIYMYNPARVNIDTKTIANKIQLATAYDEDGAPSAYAKYPIKYCSKSTGDYADLFYKFKVTNPVEIYNRVRQTPELRRYDVSGVELLTVGNSNATDYEVGYIYKYSGYAAGMGQNAAAPSTLACAVSVLETISLNVKHTYFRTASSEAGAGYQNTLNSVYFGVPNHYIDTYGKLYGVHAECWSALTNPIVVTNNREMYDHLLSYIGQHITPYDSDVGYSFYTSYTDTMLPPYPSKKYADIAFNKWDTVTAIHPLPRVNYLFYTTNNTNNYTLKNIVSTDVTGDDFGMYLRDYTLGTMIDINGKSYSSDLLCDVKYMPINITLDSDPYNLMSYDSSHPKWWQKIISKQWSTDTSTSYTDVEPIKVVTDADINKSDAQISESLLVNIDDVAEFKSYYAAAKDNNETVMLFRYATDQYYSQHLWVFKSRTALADKKSSYIAWQTIYLDYDIIDLKFVNDNGDYTVIPVVSDPMDIIPDITSPTTASGFLTDVGGKIVDAWQDLTNKDWWQDFIRALVIAGIALAAIILAIIVIKLVGWISRARDRSVARQVIRKNRRQ